MWRSAWAISLLVGTALWPREIPVRDVHLNYFVLQNPYANVARFNDALAAGPAAVWKRQAQLGGFEVVATAAGGMILCRLKAYAYQDLDASCAVRLTETAKPIRTPEPGISLAQDRTAPQTVPPQGKGKGAEIIADIPFHLVGQVRISEKSFAFSRFQTLENLNSFLGQLKVQTGSTWRFSIPGDRLIRDHGVHFRDAWKDGFYLCLVEGRIGYCHVDENGGLEFKTISVSTLSAMADKFFLQLLAQKNE